MTSVLVTGGSGFIGRQLVGALVSRGEHVRVLDLARSDDLPAAAEFVRASVTDGPAVEAALQGVDCLYHLAGIAHLWARRKSDFDLVNRQGTETVLRAAAAARVRRVVHCSTESILLPKRSAGRAVVDESVAPSLEDMPGPYTRSKFLGERAAIEAARGGLDLVVVNPTVPIGAGDRNMTPPATMLALFLAGGSPFFLDCVLNLVGVRDLADGLILAAERGRSGERYILGGENIPLRKLLPRLEGLSGRRMPRLAIPPKLALAAAVGMEGIGAITGREPTATSEGVRIALRSAPFDSNKARRELGYAPRPVTAALQEAVTWLSVERQLVLEPRP